MIIISIASLWVFTPNNIQGFMTFLKSLSPLTNIEFKNITSNTDQFCNATECHTMAELLDTGLTTIVYNATSVINITGTHDGGNLASLLKCDDDDSYNISEIVGVNPLTVEINFSSNVSSFDILRLNVRYDDGGGHTIPIGLYDWDSGTYEFEYGEIEDTGGEFVFYHILVSDPSEHIENGTVSLILDHLQAGNPTHDLFIGCSQLIEGVLSANIDHEHESFVLRTGDNMTGNLNIITPSVDACISLTDTIANEETFRICHDTSQTELELQGYYSGSYNPIMSLDVFEGVELNPAGFSGFRTKFFAKGTSGVGLYDAVHYVSDLGGGVGQAGDGIRIKYIVEDGSGVRENTGYTNVYWDDPTNNAEDSAFSIELMDDGNLIPKIIINDTNTIINTTYFTHNDESYSSLEDFFQDDIYESCSAGSSIRIVHDDGQVTCETDSVGGGCSGWSGTICVCDCEETPATPQLFDWNKTYLRDVAVNLHELKGIAVISLENYTIDSNFTFWIKNVDPEVQYYEKIALNVRCHKGHFMRYSDFEPDQDQLIGGDDTYVFLKQNESGKFSFSNLNMPAKCNGADFINWQLEIHGYYERLNQFVPRSGNQTVFFSSLEEFEQAENMRKIYGGTFIALEPESCEQEGCCGITVSNGCVTETDCTGGGDPPE